jgi:hypothetical protein
MTADTINQIIYASSLGVMTGLIIWYQKRSAVKLEENFNKHIENENKKTDAHLAVIEAIKNQLNILTINLTKTEKDIEFLDLRIEKLEPK